jgi:hypothetical protein
LQQSIAPSQVPETRDFSSAHEDPATPFSPQDDAVVESPPVRTRHSKYPLRIREPKRQWDESLLSDTEPDEPENYAAALTSPDSKLWMKAIREEYDSLIHNNTWTVTTLPANRNPIKSKWIFKIKPGVNGAEPRYKARLVAKGYSQRFGMDFDQTFAPVAKQDTLRIVLPFVAAYDLEMRQLDIKTAFLYVELSEEIYLEQPEGFITAGQEEMVCRLHKCLYGLKQASRVWNQHFDSFLRNFGLTPSDYDPCLYYRHRKGEITMVIIWVDDGWICSNNNDAIFEIINYLSKNFEMRSSEANHFVGLSIHRKRKEKFVYVSQSDYTSKIIRRFHMDQCNPTNLPVTPGLYLSKSETEEEAIIKFPTKKQQDLFCI